jgi:hypothetical protein
MCWHSSCATFGSMRLLNKHILTFGRLLLVFFFLANSGFTVVLYHCTMADEMCGMSCCDGKNDSQAGACEDMDGPQTPATHPVTVDQPCQTVTVLGGYQVDPTVVAKAFDGRQIIKIDLLPNFVYQTAIGDRVDLPAFHLVSAASNVSTPSVETYVLNATFLI